MLAERFAVIRSDDDKCGVELVTKCGDETGHLAVGFRDLVPVP